MLHTSMGTPVFRQDQPFRFVKSGYEQNSRARDSKTPMIVHNLFLGNSRSQNEMLPGEFSKGGNHDHWMWMMIQHSGTVHHVECFGELCLVQFADVRANALAAGDPQSADAFLEFLPEFVSGRRNVNHR